MDPSPGRRPVLDLTGALFVDHRALDIIEAVAEALDCEVRVVGASPVGGQMVSLRSSSRLRVGGTG